jgi:transposase-like protein
MAPGADQLRPKIPKLAALMDEAESDVLDFMSFPKDHRPKLHSVNPLERLNYEAAAVLLTPSNVHHAALHADRGDSAQPAVESMPL